MFSSSLQDKDNLSTYYGLGAVLDNREGIPGLGRDNEHTEWVPHLYNSCNFEAL